MIAALTPLLYTLGPAALLLVMAVVFAESGLLIGFFLPGDSLLFLAGALVASHVIGLPIWLLAAGVFVAAVVGDQVGYLIGRRFGPRLFSRPDSRFFSRDNADRAQQFFDRHGPKAVVLARFVPVVRTFVPAVAGVGHMPRPRFTMFNVVGAIVWSIGIVSAGFLFGGIPVIAGHIEIITIGLAGLSIIPGTVAYLRGRKRRAAAATPHADVLA
ncbi:VTT domain-containing protein [Aeromicrobium sp.]|uniref:VTT domain-containing protein n=1 Tax=Aeromicrobium sp. TaxID=1871063 RepID=UPI003C401E35